MKLFQKKIWICFMGFSVLSLFSGNPAIADEKSNEAAKEKVRESAKDAKRKTKKGIRKTQDEICEVVGGKKRCVAKKAEHSMENAMDKVQDAAD